MQPNDNHYQPGSELPHPATKAIDFAVPETAKHQPAKAEQASKAAELPQLHPGQQPGSVSQLPTSRLPLAPFPKTLARAEKFRAWTQDGTAAYSFAAS